MSTMINIAPLIAKVIRDMLDEQAAVLDVESVFAKLVALNGTEIFEAERFLAEIAIRQKIKAHLRTAYSINGDDDVGQLSLIKEDVPAALAVKQPGGGYAYVPLRLAGLADLDAATKAKVDNIKHAEVALEKWKKAIDPIRKVMKALRVTFGEAQKLAAEQPKKRTRAAKRA